METSSIEFLARAAKALRDACENMRQAGLAAERECAEITTPVSARVGLQLVNDVAAILRLARGIMGRR